MKRTRLADRQLPTYTRGEELMNTLTHGIGGVLGILVLLSCVVKAAQKQDLTAVIGCAVYGAAFIIMFTISSVYHGLKPSMGKKVMQVIDHCTIYFLIAGTYTAVLLGVLCSMYPRIGWGILIFEWTLAILAAVLTAIDLKKYSVFSMICYIGMGWAILPFAGQTLQAMTLPGFILLLGGGIAYTVGSILYGLGKKRRWMHSVFHIFVVAGAGLQYLAVLCYAI